MALRKLQAEIDKTLKLVTAGVEQFESTFDKLNNASNETQKVKLEGDLKTQIKKLQRMRDQIKVWLGNGDIKDKSSLLEARKSIESMMEKFKELERGMKMKAFSKEGLIAASRLDPAEKAKRDMIQWIIDTIDELSRQIEATEAEVEQIQSIKKKKSSIDRLSELEQLNERRQWHIGRLEIVQRMFENNQLDIDQVEMIQEDVKYFVEANTEEDFDFDLGIYDELNLQEGEDEYNADYGHAAEDSSNIDSASVADDSSKTPSKEERKSKASSYVAPDDVPPSPVSTKRSKKDKEAEKAEKRAAKEAEKAARAAEKAAAVAAAEKVDKPEKATTEPVATATTPTKPATMPTIRYAAAAAAAVGSSHPAPGAAAASEPVSLSKQEPSNANEENAVVEPSEVEMEPPVSEADAYTQQNGHSPAPPPGISASPSPAPQESVPSSSGTPANGSQSGPAFSHAESSRAASAAYSSPRKEGVLENLMHSFGVAKDMAERRANDPNELNAALDVSYHNAPSQLDAEPPRYYHPSNPIQTPSYYPQTRLPQLEDKSMYQRLELDQLFYIFYYMTGTYEQWLAAQELKRQSWRFHKQYLTWFQRAHNPQAITEDYEQGGYYYFDWENSWCQRRKSDFRFEYRWLSDH